MDTKYTPVSKPSGSLGTLNPPIPYSEIAATRPLDGKNSVIIVLHIDFIMLRMERNIRKRFGISLAQEKHSLRSN